MVAAPGQVYKTMVPRHTLAIDPEPGHTWPEYFLLLVSQCAASLSTVTTSDFAVVKGA